MKMTEGLREGMILAMGNPLLDISVVADDDLLKKYNLKANDAILAEDKHMPLYGDLERNYAVEYIAGGSSQNSMRVAQWILQKPNVAIYIGCVGNDEHSKILESRARADGVDVKYQYTEKKPTGTCAVIVSSGGTKRSLVANLAAAEAFTQDHLSQPDVKRSLAQADFYYSSGYFITVSIETILDVAQIAHKRNKIFMLNLSAPFIPKFFKDKLMTVLPYVDILFGNETEAITLAEEENYQTKDMKEIALRLSKMPKQNPDRPRIVVITQGTDPVILAKDNSIQEFPVKVVKDDKVVDTNGAGDAFVGGFIAQLIKGEEVDTCIKCGIWAASHVVQHSGCTFSGNPEFTC